MSGTSAGLSDILDVMTLSSTPIPSIPGPTGLEIANFVVSLLGTMASTAIAIIAIILTVGASRKATKRETRASREAWVRDFNVWLDAGKVHMASGAGLVADPDWVTRGNELSARAQILESRGANSYMVAAKTARSHIATLPAARRVEASRTATQLLKFWAIGWVDSPSNSPSDIVEWIDTVVSARDGHDGPPSESK